MTIARVLCASLGHRWRTVEGDAPFPIMLCIRCGRNQTLADGTAVLPGLVERREKLANVCAEIGTGIPKKPR